MKIVFFCHSLLSDWNHGNAHFLRGVASELVLRGHDVKVFEPASSWSYRNLTEEHGPAPLDGFAAAYPELRGRSERYDVLELDKMLDDADLVLVHEWNPPSVVNAIGRHHAEHPGYRLLFHDTHHRALSAPLEMAQYNLFSYDGVLAYGTVLTGLYLECGWARRAWTWHEAADVRLFHPLPHIRKTEDLVWIGNWGDEERTAELHEFLINPVHDLKLKASVFGVRYPEEGLEALRAADINYGGWLANYLVPETFARFRVTVHVPRRPYANKLVGIPTIRPFEALACGIPLVSALWDDAEKLFSPGADFLVARNGAEMKEQLQAVLSDSSLAQSLAEHGRKTILARHTCAHRVDELLNIYESL